jgi:hypothetical protein
MENVKDLCRKKFEIWAIKNLLIAKGENYEQDPVWMAWKASWARAYSSACEQERQKYKEYNKPLSDKEVKELWNHCGTGKGFARLIESRHGIK